MPTDELVLELAPTAESVRTARQLTVGRCRRWLPEACDDVAVVVTELVTNGVRHARTPLRVALSRRPGALRVAVTDRDPRPLRRPLRDRGDAEGGRGLLLVDRISVRWGVAHHDGKGKTVWCEVGPHPAG